MPAAPQDFHYMTVLHELEKAVIKLHPDKASLSVADTKLTSLVAKLYGKMVNLSAQWGSLEERIDFQLGAEEGRQIELEEKIVAQIAKLTGDLQHQGRHRRLTGQWPPVIPLARMVERFTALTIGLHSEDPAQPFHEHVASAFREAVLPGLAWGLMIELYGRPKEVRRSLQTALGKHLRETKVELHLDLDERSQAHLDYLLLVDAWLEALSKPALGSINVATLQTLRITLAELIEKDLGDLDTLLWEELGGQYLAVAAGTERAMAVARAEKHSAGSAAFLRERLSLFEAAQEKDLQAFRNLVETDLEKSLKWPFDACTAPAGKVESGPPACGGAFWLARSTFGQHQPRNEEGNPLNESIQEKASTHTVFLLLRAALMFKDKAAQSDRLHTCLRYAAGYATNPRYSRSLSVLRQQQLLVDLYAEHPLHRDSLVSLFRGRIAWQQWVATGQDRDRKAALGHYYAALKRHRDDRHGFDAEAPVHFFPELTHLLRQDNPKQNKVAKTLAAVDFITQRNYGIYFDIEREAEKIGAGLIAFRRYHRLEALTKAFDSPLAQPSAEISERIAEFQRTMNTPEAKGAREAMGEISRAIGFNN